ncbi:hypothetical protein K438DRAFT_1703578, partial [Mycena galopus ATCC 62051]
MPSFPSSGMQTLSALIHFFGVTILTHFLSRSLAVENLSSRNTFSLLTWPRLCTLLIFLDSWAFLFSSGILIFGVGLETDAAVCEAGIYLCIVFYSSSKFLIYSFLIEKVHVVWDVGEKRFKSPVYIICVVTVSLYAAVIALLFFGKSSFLLREIGLKAMASIPLLSYDLYINVLLTGLFLWPLLRSNLSTPRLRKVAIRTLLSSGVALTTSTVNIVVLTVLKGHELGWVCLASCGTDVIVNAFALFWVTGASRQESTSFCVECDRGITENASEGGVILNISAKNSSVRHLSRGPESLRSWENTNSKRNSIRPNMNDNPELAGRRHSMLKSMSIFRMGAAPREAQEFQIHVTTEFDSSTSPPATDRGETGKADPDFAPALATDS